MLSFLNFPAVSTRKIKESDAAKQAWIWFREGIPHKGGALDLKTYSLRNMIHYAEITQSDAEYIVNELKRQGLILSCVFPGDAGAVRFADFLSEFWDWERSPYPYEHKPLLIMR